MSDSPGSYVHDLVIGLAGAFASRVPGLFRGWLRNRDRVLTDQVQLATIVTAVARLEATMKRQEEDLDGVAHTIRTRLKILEAVFTERTGEMPRLQRDTGEQESRDE